ncbi:MarR family winged helix-turn-helix transcriptional regulator, partial [Alkalibacillus haloalkaliphilus]|uniref:MarR family winged helix-turn-helix transcriptional regulator n=1 Tax=Alkalibacillus haloalkaliphilus TaxID=94136 RepID=UPI00037B8E2A
PYIPKKLFGQEQLLQTGDLHPSHFHILHMVQQLGPIRMSEIAQASGINKSNLTPLIHKLIDYHYIEKEKSSHDRRVTYIHLTSEGQAFLTDKKKVLEAKVENRLSTLTKDEQIQLKQAFKMISSILSKLD